jgi:Flp pilus assembly protein TadG
MVEFTLISLLLIPLVIGAIEVGRGVWYYNQLSQLSRESARWLLVTTAKRSRTDTEKRWMYTGNADTGGFIAVSSCSCPNTAIGWIKAQDVGIPNDELRVQIDWNGLTDNTTQLTWGWPVEVSLEYTYRPILAQFIGVSAAIPLRATTEVRAQ